jgi:hypothetical protein
LVLLNVAATPPTVWAPHSTGRSNRSTRTSSHLNARGVL